MIRVRCIQVIREQERVAVRYDVVNDAGEIILDNVPATIALDWPDQAAFFAHVEEGLAKKLAEVDMSRAAADLVATRDEAAQLRVRAEAAEAQLAAQQPQPNPKP